MLNGKFLNLEVKEAGSLSKLPSFHAERQMKKRIKVFKMESFKVNATNTKIFQFGNLPFSRRNFMFHNPSELSGSVKILLEFKLMCIGFHYEELFFKFRQWFPKGDENHISGILNTFEFHCHPLADSITLVSFKNYHF